MLIIINLRYSKNNVTSFLIPLKYILFLLIFNNFSIDIINNSFLNLLNMEVFDGY